MRKPADFSAGFIFSSVLKADLLIPLKSQALEGYYIKDTKQLMMF
jgi:hypothetical protein